MFNIKIKADSKSIMNFKKATQITEDTRRGIRQAYYRMGKKTIADIRQDILRKPRYGRLYIINGRRHIASVPGEAPANFTGALRKSLDFLVQGYQKLYIGYDNSVDYGIWLEIGTKKMEPRPGIKINIEKNQNNGSYEKMFEQEIKRALILKGR